MAVNLSDIALFDTAWMDSDLRARGIRHTCGGWYAVSWLNEDGIIFKANAATDTYAAILTAKCKKCIALGHHETVGEALAIDTALQAEEITQMLALGPRDFLPPELMEVAEMMGFKAEAGWELPSDHPLALAA